MKKMKVVLLSEPTESEEIRITECSIPDVRPGWVLIKIKAFGLNHSEQILRQSEINAAYIRKPIIPGIECVGEIADPSDSGFVKGQKVIAMMGGMGRNFHGSYAEYVLVPKMQVFSVRTEMRWELLGAVPETYFTAWETLFECLHLQKEDHLLIRGATCALGYASIQLAKEIGCAITAATHREEKRYLLKEAGADRILTDTGNINGAISGITKALELVGAKTLFDTLQSVEKGGIICHTGVLGGQYALNRFDPIKHIPNGVYLTGFYSNMPTQQAVDAMMQFLEEHQLKPCIGKVYCFSEIASACMDIDNGRLNGKAVIVMDE